MSVDGDTHREAVRVLNRAAEVAAIMDNYNHDNPHDVDVDDAIAWLKAAAAYLTEVDKRGQSYLYGGTGDSDADEVEPFVFDNGRLDMLRDYY